MTMILHGLHILSSHMNIYYIGCIEFSVLSYYVESSSSIYLLGSLSLHDDGFVLSFLLLLFLFLLCSEDFESIYAPRNS
ncbi:hypothetical protein CPC08DRAFT_270078 [Agrocybe pediades]|nr:hypothetical protein CPC08DRAFT_270078 [Agrocybe pediades]